MARSTEIKARWKEIRPFFSKRLLELQHDKQLKSKDFAPKLDLSLSTLGKLEADSYPSPNILLTLKLFLDSDPRRAGATANRANSEYGAAESTFLGLKTLIEHIYKGSKTLPIYVDEYKKAQHPTISKAIGTGENKLLVRPEMDDSFYELSVDQQKFEQLCKKSFDYLLRRKREPRVDSNTCMFFFGLLFNPKSPVFQKEAPVQALETELEHLEEVSFPNKIHNPEKPGGAAQTADEIIDIFRCLFMLAIANGIEDFNAVKWVPKFCEPYRQPKSESAEIQKVPRELFELFVGLRELILFPGINLRQSLVDWLGKELTALGMFARDYGISLTLLTEDLESRLNDKHVTTQHSRHKKDFKPFVTFIDCLICLPDKPGAYTVLLEAIAEAEFNVLASASTTIVWNETAKAKFLLTMGSRRQIHNYQIKRRLGEILDCLWKDEKPLLISSVEISRKSVQVDSERGYLAEARDALRKFWQGFDLAAGVKT